MPALVPRLLAVALLAASLVACDDGGGSGEADVAPDAPPADASPDADALPEDTAGPDIPEQDVTPDADAEDGDADAAEITEVTPDADADAETTPDADDAEVSPDADDAEITPDVPDADDTQDLPDLQDGEVTPDVPDVPDADDAPDVADVPDIDDVGPDVPPVDAPIGQINVVWWATDALFDYPELYAHGAFSAPLASMGLVDAGAWLSTWGGWDVFVPDDYWPLPDVGEVVAVDLGAPLEAPGDLALGDAGLFVTLGEWIVAHVLEDLLASEGVPVYASLLEEGADLATLQPADQPLDLFVDGGPDVASIELPGAVTMPPPVTLTSHDVHRPVPLRYGEDLVLEWDPAPATDDADTSMIITAEGWNTILVTRVPDANGSANLTEIFGSQLEALQALGAVSIQRHRREQVELAEGPLTVATAWKQWLYPEPVGAWDMEPTVWPAGQDVDVTLRLWDHDLTAAGQVVIGLDPALTASKPQIVDTEGQVLRFTVTVPFTATTGPVDLTVSTAPADAPQEPAPVLEVPEAAFVARPLPSAGDCQSAVDEGPLPDGTYISTDEGLDADGFLGAADVCPAGEPDGREQVVPIALQAGQTLHARLWREHFAPALYIAGACGDTFPVFPCDDAATVDRPAELIYTAWQDEEVLLVLDGHGWPDSGADTLLLDLRRSEPAPFVVAPRHIVQDATTPIDVLSLVGDIEGADVAFDFGPGVVVEAVEYFDPDWAGVTVKAVDAVEPLTRDVTVTVDGTVYVVPDAMTVRPFYTPPFSCEEAETAPATGPGTYQGVTLAEDVVTESPCGYAPFGPEAVHRVELGPGETLHATVHAPGEDAFLYVVPDCGTPVTTCSDDAAVGGPEYISWTGPAEPSSVLLVVDTVDFGVGTTYTLELEVGP